MDLRLGTIKDIPPHGAKQYSVDLNDTVLECFVVHHQDNYYAYENRCPHVGVELNWQPDVFLNIEQTHIQCSTHGAQFRINDGLCEWGPCVGQSLHPLTLKIQNGNLFLVL